MAKETSEKTKLNIKKVRFNLNAPKIERVSLAGDSNGCVLVIPEIFEMNEHIGLYQGRLTEYQL